MRVLISSRYADYETKKAIKFQSHGLETWIPKAWILEQRRENPDDLFCEYWINIPEDKKTNKELILIAFMQFMSREIKQKGVFCNLDGIIEHARSTQKEFEELKNKGT